jgi:hypothetical protein
MKVPLGNSLCNYLKLAKMPFLFSLFCKIREQEDGTVLPEQVDTNGMGGGRK